MTKKHLMAVLLALTLISSLLSGTVASGAQTPPTLTESYTWEPYHLSVAYPDGWDVMIKDNGISLRPADRDVSDGLGPELVLFTVAYTPGQFDTVLASLAAPDVQFGTPDDSVLEGYLTRFVPLTWPGSATMGGLLLVKYGADTALAATYRVRTSELARFQPLFDAMLDSLTFETLSTAARSTRSVSVASVQLPQRMVWNAGGLSLALPEGWISEESTQDGEPLLLITPDSADPHAVYVLLLEDTRERDLRDLAQGLAETERWHSVLFDTTVAGSPGVTYEALGTDTFAGSHLWAVFFALPDRQNSVLLLLATDEDRWQDFRPVASAIVSSVELSAAPISTLPRLLTPDLSSGYRVATTTAGSKETALARRQDGKPFNWEEYGVTFTLPDAWETIQGGQDFDLALASPEAASGGSGSFIVIQVFPSLGPDMTPESALQPIAEQVKSEVKPFVVGEIAGVAIEFQDEQAKTFNHLVLLPYGSKSAMLYFQTSALSEDENAAIMNILSSMTISPLEADHAAVDAAWQASLAADGSLSYGDAAAPVHMVEFLDFSCGHCATYSADVERLIPLEVTTGRIRLELVLLDTVGGDLSNAAAQATYCAAEQGKGYSAYKALWQGYMNEGRDTAYARDGISRLLSDLDLDIDALNACIDDGTYADQISGNGERGNSLGVTGTPSVLLGVGDEDAAFMLLPSGEKWAGEVPIYALRAVLKKVIDDKLSLPDAVTAFFNEEG